MRSFPPKKTFRKDFFVLDVKPSAVVTPPPVAAIPAETKPRLSGLRVKRDHLCHGGKPPGADGGRR